MTSRERYEIVERVAKLPPAEQIALIEDLLRALRKAFTDRAEIERQMDAMVADPDMQRVLANEI